MISRKTMISGFVWRFLEKCGSQLVSIIVQLVLARLLSPSDFGTIAIVTVFINLLHVFVDSGLGNALIQKVDADDSDFSTVFFFNIIVCVMLYFLLFVLAPIISQYFEDGDLCLILRVMGLSLVISGVKNIQQAYVSRHLLFKKFFYSTVGGTILSAFVGIYLAYSGFGVWALVVQYLLNLSVDTLILWIVVDWRPNKFFSLSRLKGLFSYGWKLLVASLLDTIYANLRQLLIGKFYTKENLAFYNRGLQLPNVIVTNINSSIDSVLFTSMSSEQNDRLRVRNIAQKSLMISTFLMIPMMVGLAVCSEALITVVLTEKWLPCIFYLRIFCFIFSFYPIHTTNLNTINALGHSDVFLKLELYKIVVGIIILFVTVKYGVKVIVLGEAFASIIGQIINSYPNKEYIGYGYLDQIKDIIPNIIISICMGVCIYPISLVGISPIIKLIIQIIMGIFVFIFLCLFIKPRPYKYLVDVLSQWNS